MSIGKVLILKNNYVLQPPNCHSRLSWSCGSHSDSSWVPSPPSSQPLIGQVDAMSKLLLSTIFHGFSRKNFMVHFLSHQPKQCVRSIPRTYTWLQFGLAQCFSLFFPWVINYTDIVLAQKATGLLDSFGVPSKVRLWNLISVLDFNIPLRGLSGALFCLCSVSVSSAVQGHAGSDSGGNSPCRTASHGSLGADLCKLHYKLHSGLLCTLSQCKQQHHFPSSTMNQTELIWPMSKSTPLLCTPPNPFNDTPTEPPLSSPSHWLHSWKLLLSPCHTLQLFHFRSLGLQKFASQPPVCSQSQLETTANTCPKCSGKVKYRAPKLL